MNFENAKKTAQASQLVNCVFNKKDNELKKYNKLYNKFNDKKDFYHYVNVNKKFIKLNGISFIKKEFGINNIKSIGNEKAIVEIWEDESYPHEIELISSRILHKNNIEKEDVFSKITDYKIIDTQTTGIDPKTDKIIAIAIIEVKDNKILNKEKIFIDPNLNQEELKNYQKEQDFSGKSPFSISKIRVPGMENVVENFITEKAAIKLIYKKLQNSIIVGHNLNFEIKMIEALFLRNHVKENLALCKIIKNKICTLKSLKEKNIIKNNSLDGWIKHLNIKTYDRGDYHDPLKDSEILFNIINNTMK